MKLFIITILTFSFVLVSYSALAGTGAQAPGGGAIGIPLTAEIENPLGKDVKDIYAVIANVTKTLLGLVGVAALIMFIYGGGMWMISAGNAERIRQGRETLVWAAIGLAIIFSSYALVNLLLKAFEATNGS